MKKDLILIGMPGCGKSSIGRLLADRLNMEFTDLDDEIERIAQKTVNNIFAEIGEAGFRQLETEAFAQSIGKGRIIATGGGIVTVEANLQIAREGIVVFIDRPAEKILSDVNTSTRPLLADGKERIYALLNERYALYKEWADVHIVNDKTKEQLLDKIVAEVKDYENNGD